GSVLDRGFDSKRWSRWRPSVCICQHETLLINKYYLLYQKKDKTLCDLIINDISLISPETETYPVCLDFEDPWDFEEVYEGLYNYISTLNFDPDEEEYLFHITTGTHVAQICIFLLTESRLFPGKLLQTSPSKNSCGTYAVIDLDLSKYDRIAQRYRQEMKNDISFLKHGIETKNEMFNKLIEHIEYVVLRTNDPVLLTGPTGAGKSVLAKRIYELKKLRGLVKGNFIEINCATLRGDAAMSALFGHKKGSFTGAVNDRAGLLKAADKGMIFLDEVGELGPDEQAMLLRAIEEKKFTPLGSDKEEQSSFELICGTNRNLKDDISTGKFREDLLARINLWTFKLPGLRDRREDIGPNIDYELKRYEEKNGIRISFNKEAKEKFMTFAQLPDSVWNSNFRDLNAAVTRMSVLCREGRINADIVNDEIERLQNNWKNENTSEDNTLMNLLSIEQIKAIDLFDRVQLCEVVRVCRKSDSLSHAGRILFSVSRIEKNKTNDADRLRKYLSKYGLSWEMVKGG
ncbi:MAG: RNA repair transcriptional activator RtcR, partial [Spirochaetes bacterium]|nr:RNA repair transcriptional activator RtcR [Spirochaetota bacterium]